jgi:hypothetical protein
MDRTNAGNEDRRARRAGGPWPAAAGAAVLLALLAGPPAALGNGGALRVANVPMGEYRVSVFTDPTPVRPDSLDVSVLILHEGREGVAQGVAVWVGAEAVGHDAPDSWARATREQADDPRYYSAKFALGGEGRWRITVELEGDHGQGSASFEVTAREPGPLSHPLVAMLLALLPLGVAGWWVLRDGDDEVSPGARREASSGA